jgi:hypothetical protein
MVALLVAALCCAIGDASSPPWPPGYDPPIYMHKHVVQNAKARGAVCNDGNPAVFYYRGCNNTYYRGDCLPQPCPGGCLNIPSQWVIHFGTSETPFCSDEKSCMQREKTQRFLVSPLQYNDTQNWDGLLQPYPESNPSFYKAHTVYVPYCSSDLWLGNATSEFGFHFRGRNIVKAVIEDLLLRPETGQDDDGETEGKLRFNFTGADQILMTGGPGLVAQSSFVNSLLPPRLKNKTNFVCDACVLLETSPLVSVQQKPCVGVLDCPYNVSLKAAWNLWGAPNLSCKGSRGAVADPYSCLMMPQMLNLVKDTAVLFQHPFYDGMWPLLRFVCGYALITLF